jgi:hypothetical protein
MKKTPFKSLAYLFIIFSYGIGYYDIFIYHHLSSSYKENKERTLTILN